MQKAMEPLKAPINIVSEEETKAMGTPPYFFLWGHSSTPMKASGGEVTPPGSLGPTATGGGQGWLANLPDEVWVC